MNRNALILWPLVLVGFLAALAACTSRTQPPAGVGTVTPNIRASGAPSTGTSATTSPTVGVKAGPSSVTKLKFSEAMGKTAPDFSLESVGGGTVRLADYRGKKNVVLFFTEGTMCYPACWDQMAQFGADKRFNNEDTAVLSIGVNSRNEWEKIIRQAPQIAGAPILLDTTKAVSSAYDVLSLRSSMHPGTLPGHTYFIIDKQGITRFAFDDPDMGIRNDKLADELKKLES